MIGAWSDFPVATSSRFPLISIAPFPSLCPQPQQGEELCQVDQSFGLLAFLGSQRSARILTVEKGPQADSDTFGQSEPGPIGGEIDFDSHGHGSLRKRSSSGRPERRSEVAVS
jgi:hypothetical protein